LARCRLAGEARQANHGESRSSARFRKHNLIGVT
jgi:hypothetical protein